MTLQAGNHKHVSTNRGGCTMKPLRSALAIITLAVLAGWIHPSAVQAQANADYTSSPPFINTVAVPNILIVMDNSGSMENRACESTSCGVKSDGTTSTSTNFDATTRYNGFADPLGCFKWDGTDKRFEKSSTKAAIGNACGSL